MLDSTARSLRRTGAAVLIGAAALGFAGSANAAVETGRMYGDPVAAGVYWAHQTLDDCALMSAADVIGQVTGTAPTEDEIIDVASHMASPNHPGSIYFPPEHPDDPNSGFGTDTDDLPALLAHYGVRASTIDDDSGAEAGAPTGLAAIEQALTGGHAVIAFVNTHRLWDDDGDRSTPNHALVVTGVDTARGIVHLNDSGTDDGRDEQVPIATFTDAWRDHVMVVTA